jgi:hypothetical protein
VTIAAATTRTAARADRIMYIRFDVSVPGLPSGQERTVRT